MNPRWKSVNWPVRTERLAIRPITDGDIDAVFDIRGRDEVARWMSGRAVDRDLFREKFMAAHDWTHTLVIELDSRVIGDLYLGIQDGWAQTEVADQGAKVEAEIGWTLHPDLQGHGYATEAVTALLRLCFTDLGLRRVTALCFADNAASWRLMERVGMRREAHHVADSLHRSGQWLDGLAYAVLADEWRAHDHADRERVPNPLR